MSFIHYNNHIFVKKSRLNFFSPKIWRIMYLIKTTLIYHTAEKRIWMRNSCIPLTFLLYDIILYSGNYWVTRKITFWNIGFKFGEFTFTRKYTFFKKKKKKKK